MASSEPVPSGTSASGERPPTKARRAPTRKRRSAASAGGGPEAASTSQPDAPAPDSGSPAVPPSEPVDGGDAFVEPDEPAVGVQPQEPASGVGAIDFGHLSPFRRPLMALDDALRPDLANLPELAAPLPLSVWCEMLLEPERWLLRAHEWLPAMPPDDVQRHFSGTAGKPAMAWSRSVLEALLRGMFASGDGMGTMAPVIDFGMAWGGLARLLLKYVAVDRLRGYVMSDLARDACAAGPIPFPVERVERALEGPLPGQPAGLIIAPTQFCILAPEVFTRNLQFLADSMVVDGVLALIVRTPELWLYLPDPDPDAVVATLREGIHHVPLGSADFGSTAVDAVWLVDQAGRAGLAAVSAEALGNDPTMALWLFRKTAAGPVPPRTAVPRHGGTG